MGKASSLFGFHGLEINRFRSHGNSHQKASVSQGKDLAKPRGITLRDKGYPPDSLKTCHAIKPEGSATLKSEANPVNFKETGAFVDLIYSTSKLSLRHSPGIESCAERTELRPERFLLLTFKSTGWEAGTSPAAAAGRAQGLGLAVCQQQQVQVLGGCRGMERAVCSQIQSRCRSALARLARLRLPSSSQLLARCQAP